MFCQEFGFQNFVGYEEECNCGEDKCWQFFDEEQNFLWCNGVFDLGDIVCQNFFVDVCYCSVRNKDIMMEGDFVMWVEE